MWQSATEDYEEVERRAYDTGSELIQLQEQRDSAQLEFDKLQIEREKAVQEMSKVNFFWISQ